MRFFKFSLLILLMGIAFSCQKELDYEADPLAHGTLKKDVAGDCLPSTINGIYAKDVNLDASNYIDVQVELSNPGTYEIFSDTVNGYSFKAVGNATEIGSQSIRLIGQGRPIDEGTNIFSIHFDGTVCTAEVVVTGPGTPQAGYNLGGAPGNCTGATLTGTYAAGEAIGAGSTVTISINVISTGVYSISTNTVNGIQFSGSGYIGSTGSQTLSLNASGTPAAAGNFNFVVSNAVDNCSFSVTVTGTTPPADNNDYFPLTAFSNWTMHTVGAAATDTTYFEVSQYEATISGNTYRAILNKETGNVVDSIPSRKLGTKVYQYYTSNFGILLNEISAEIQLLDTTLAAGSTWDGTLGTGATAAGNVTVTYSANVIERGVQATVAGTTYQSVIKVHYTYYADPGTGPTEALAQDIWFARGKGIVYNKAQVTGLPPAENELVRAQIY